MVHACPRGKGEALVGREPVYAEVKEFPTNRIPSSFCTCVHWFQPCTFTLMQSDIDGLPQCQVPTTNGNILQQALDELSR